MYSEPGPQTEDLSKVRSYINVMECYFDSAANFMLVEYPNFSPKERRNITSERWAMIDILSRMKYPENLNKNIDDFIQEIRDEYTDKRDAACQELNKEHYTNALDLLNNFECIVHGIYEESEDNLC